MSTRTPTRTEGHAMSMHRAQWTKTDPTGGDPDMGGPVLITVCAVCGAEARTGDHPSEDNTTDEDA